MTKLLSLGLLLIAITGCTQQETSLVSPDRTTVVSFIDGQKKSLAEFNGQWLLVNFWSVSCPPCFQEMPELSRLHDEMATDDFAVIGIAMPYDRPDMILETQQRKNLSYPIAIDIQGTANNAFGTIRVVPTSILLNPDGEIVWQHAGVITYDGFNKKLSELRSRHQNKG